MYAAHPEQTLLSRELVLDWIGDASASSYDIAQRAASIRQFASIPLRPLEKKRIFCLEKYAPLKSKAAAYIFTDAELAALFRAIDQLRLRKRNLF